MKFRGAVPAPSVSRHSHAYSMVYEHNKCYCTECDQSWFMKVETNKSGREFRKWIPMKPKDRF